MSKLRIRMAGKGPEWVDAVRTYFDTLPRYVEIGTPRRISGETQQSWQYRLRHINENQFCAKIIEADYDRNDCSITVKIEPYGPFGPMLEKIQTVELALSARALNKMVDGKPVIERLIGFDLIQATNHVDYQTEETQ